MATVGQLAQLYIRDKYNKERAEDLTEAEKADLQQAEPFYASALGVASRRFDDCLVVHARSTR